MWESLCARTYLVSNFTYWFQLHLMVLYFSEDTCKFSGLNRSPIRRLLSKANGEQTCLELCMCFYIPNACREKKLSCWPVAANKVGPPVLKKRFNPLIRSQTRWSWQNKMCLHLVFDMFISTRATGHIRENHLQVTLLPQLSKYVHASRVYWHCA